MAQRSSGARNICVAMCVGIWNAMPALARLKCDSDSALRHADTGTIQQGDAGRTPTPFQLLLTVVVIDRLLYPPTLAQVHGDSCPVRGGCISLCVRWNRVGALTDFVR